MSQDGAQGRYAGGSVAGGRYQLRDLLGEGGMASVYLAYDSALDRQVAIKTLHTELGREQSFRERFRREAQAVAKLSHTNIVSVFDTGEDTLTERGSAAGSGALMPYIVMEYVEGQPLGSVLQADIQQYGAMPADKALKVTADVLAALESSHEMGLVHRDIKPGNVMMTKRGIVKVMDFGIARAMQSGVTSMTQTGMVVGTPQYLSPEQALGRGVDARSDLYSVGIMLFQLLTGRIPFDADSPLAIAYAHVQEEPVAPSTINRSITPAMDALVARALKKNPNERFPSAAAMRDEIARVAGAGHTGAPVIIGGAPSTSGAGVGSAVFPPLAQSAPAPQSVQTPYQPGPYGPPTPAPTPAPAPHYGYPQTPAPAPAYGTPASTPPPYTMAPHSTTASGGSAGGGKRNMPVIVGAVVVALLAVGGLITAITLNKDSGGGDNAGGDPSSSESADTAGVVPPDRTRTIETTECTDATEDGTDPSKVQAPDVTYKDLLSVKECLRAAGWTWTVTEVDNPQYAKDAVIEQFPRQGSPVVPKNAEFELRVSTGQSG
ncbi:serine/threonine protein kinase [Streptomyces lunaelactis]|uniref:non-specific serine/threonine protein kinase n=1 Tax=Streptomyces lunaelactis TaxID=1535768 RepID=A0A2R4T4T6_9ACTN|nr:protein kinase [Streptomyces lunaelactis]AVZ74163.1 serine/threonine protein kinase [Streptomyces lunaelactis]NUK87961.1 serine/threonine protein kinase [Streptomyces lunaelactis]